MAVKAQFFFQVATYYKKSSTFASSNKNNKYNF